MKGSNYGPSFSPNILINPGPVKVKKPLSKRESRTKAKQYSL
jgi:hypothetical protein